MASVFVQDLGPMMYTVQRMLEMQDDLKLKKDVKVKAVSCVTSRFPQHFELYVETEDHKQFVQLWRSEGTRVIPASCFVAVLPPGGK